MADYFNYEGVKSHMGALDSKFSEFAEELRKANLCVNEVVHNSPESAIYGDLGANMLNTWNENASTFGDFYENFNSWSALMASIISTYATFENNAVRNVVANNQSNGANLKGIQETRSALIQKEKLKEIETLPYRGEKPNIENLPYVYSDGDEGAKIEYLNDVDSEKSDDSNGVYYSI